MKKKTQKNKPQEWEKEFVEIINSIFKSGNETLSGNYFKYPDLDFKLIKSFIRQLLVQEEANWMAEIHEQLKAEKEKVIREVRKEINKRKSVDWSDVDEILNTLTKLK